MSTDTRTSIILTTRADQIPLTRIEWLWQDHIPLGKLVLFYGLPGQGKSLVATDIIARATTGREMPNRPALLTAFDVILCASEDDWDDTARPRLMAAGADITRVHFASHTKPASNEAKAVRIALDRDIEAIQRLLEGQPNVHLVVFDPIGSYLGELDANKPHIRPMLEALKDLAKKARVTVLAILHFNKNVEQASIHRISGAGAWGEVPRAIWAFVPQPVALGQPESEEHLMLSAKLNIVAASNCRGMRYRFENAKVEMNDGKEPTDIAKIGWLGEATISLSKAMEANRTGKPGPKPVVTDAAVSWLRTFLATGPRLSKDVSAAGEAAGYSPSTLQKARRIVGAKAEQEGGEWWLKLSDS